MNMIEPLYDFGLTSEQEERAAKLHNDSIIIDALFQGPIGTYSLPPEDEEKLLKDAQKVYPVDEGAQCIYAREQIRLQMIYGKYRELYKDCWYESGITAACRQLEISYREEIYQSALKLQEEFDQFPWLIKARTVEDIRRAKRENKKAGFVTAQQTLGFGKDLDLLEEMHRFGLCVIQLTYNNHNLVGAGCMEPNDAGLSKFGISFVKKCNELGIVVDVGHTGKQSTLDACKISKKPVIASHTAAEKVFFHNRCKSDEEFKAIASTGGVIGVYAMPWFIAKDPENTTINDYLDHVEYIADLVGADHVGIGTDWPMPQTKWMAIADKKYLAPLIGFEPGDGPSTEWIHGIKDYRSFINITRGLVARGWSDGDISNFLGENWLRVFGECWK